MPRAPSTPKYRHHKPTNQAVVTLNGRDVYLGVYGTPVSRTAYDRVVAEWLASGRRPPVRPNDGMDKTSSKVSRNPTPVFNPASSDPLVTVNEILLPYLRWAIERYQRNGEPTSESRLIKQSLKIVRELYGHYPALDFGPRALKVVRTRLIESGITRKSINQRIGRIIRAFKWATSEELIPVSIYQALRTVTGLRRGEPGVIEPPPVRPVDDAHVDAVKPYVARQVWAMIELQRYTGMRPGEAVIMTTADIDRSREVWIYTPRRHKTEHHGRTRTIAIGPRAQAVLEPWLRPDEPDAPLFSPTDAETERRAKMRLDRKTKVQPSQQCRKKSKPAKTARDAYDVASYRRAIACGIDKANRQAKESGEPSAPVPRWHPHQIRHTTLTKVRREAGLDAARAVGGHSTPVVTEVYAELDQGKAEDVMSRIG